MTRSQREILQLLNKKNKEAAAAGQAWIMNQSILQRIAQIADPEAAAKIIENCAAGKSTFLIGSFDKNNTPYDDFLSLLWEIYAGSIIHSKRPLNDTQTEFWQTLRLALIELAEQEENAGASEESIKAFRSIIPKNYIMPVNKLQNNFIAIAEAGEGSLTVVKGNKKRDPVKTYVQFSFDDNNIQIAGRAEPKAFDMSIQNGIMSLLLSGNEVITPAMAYRATAGMTDSQWISPQQAATVEKIIDKQRGIKVRIDATAEAKAYNMNTDELILENYLIVAEKVMLTINGVKQIAYIFPHNRTGSIEMPILYKYAQISKQIQNIPVEVLRLPINNTEKNIVLRDYLLREIGAIRHPKATRRPEIAYSGIYDLLGIDQTGSNAKTEMKRARDATEKILSHWKSTGYIQNYQTYKKGKTIAGVKITP